MAQPCAHIFVYARPLLCSRAGPGVPFLFIWSPCLPYVGPFWLPPAPAGSELDVVFTNIEICWVKFGNMGILHMPEGGEFRKEIHRLNTKHVFCGWAYYKDIYIYIYICVYLFVDL